LLKIKNLNIDNYVVCKPHFCAKPSFDKTNLALIKQTSQIHNK
jgi:hypothetical protein